jgi:succinate dehydrogenase/fumarate reductase-like Fe-S protein
MGVCGSCGMLINGRARLACNTQITELGTNVVMVAPLPNFDTIRDLVPDLVRCRQRAPVHPAT